MEYDVAKRELVSSLLASLQLRAGANDVENDIRLIRKLRGSLHDRDNRLRLSHIPRKGYVHLTRIKTFGRGLYRL